MSMLHKQTDFRVADTASLPRTPHLILGPFYPLTPLINASPSPWGVPSGRIAAALRVLRVGGHVLDVEGKAIPDALVEMWQADEHGQYLHPMAHAEKPRDPDFTGYGVTHTDEKGNYQFVTRKPGAYVHNTKIRAPHLHFQVTTGNQRLITQMYFSNEPLNDQDYWFNVTRERQRLVARVVSETPDLLELSWHIVLGNS
jgi:protocatechuate 3,4-dioxygenase, beta subunit